MSLTYTNSNSIVTRQYPILAFWGSDIKTGRHLLFFNDSCGVCVKDSEEDIRNKKSFLLGLFTGMNLNDTNWTKIAKGKVVIRTGDSIRKLDP